MARRRGRTSDYDDHGGGWPRYVPAAERREKAAAKTAALQKKGQVLTPILLTGLKITRTFWGKAWCDNLESYSDYASRLPRGRTYVRNGSVIHLAIGDGTVEAIVIGTRTYQVTIAITPLARPRWTEVVGACAGQVTSLVELLGGKLSDGVMTIVTNRQTGLFPSPKEITLGCSCPDWATMCKHVAAVLYGVGARLDSEPELLFRLRAVDPAALIAKSVNHAATKAKRPRASAIAESALGSIFGIEMDEPAAVPARPAKKAAVKNPAVKKAAVKKATAVAGKGARS